ncbi:MAG: aminotransferase class I/II-fold pyridoxal phosphate-dependent enzyme [Saprospiraceae bacterium]|nr:aminotransferase class I/II-fold pyridoxal phosphate-dependent enzyme [Saprospiraceae bacterium]
MELDDILYHLGENHDDWYQAIAPPIYQTSNFRFKTVADFREKAKDEFKNHVYTRGNNPTVAILRKKVAALEKTEDCLVFSSGSAAVAAAILSRVSQGDHIICVDKPYTWTRKLLNDWVSRMGVNVTFADLKDAQELHKHITDKTKVIYLESPNSMTFELQDLAAISSIAKDNGIVTIIDNSSCSPLFQQPAVHGIDLIVHSATKYLNGHSDVVAGVVCGSEEHIRTIFSHEYMMLGAIISPYEAAMILRGMRTLPLRLERSDTSALKIATELSGTKGIRSVIHPMLPSFPQADISIKQMSGTGGLFSILLDTDDIVKCEQFADALTKFRMAASWGGYESLIMPMCVFNSYLGNTQPLYPTNLVRLYIGLEDPDYLLADIIQALRFVID